MNQNFYMTTNHKRGYYPKVPPYGTHQYGYGNPPVIVLQAYTCIHDSSSDSEFSSSESEYTSEDELLNDSDLD